MSGDGQPRLHIDIWPLNHEPELEEEPPPIPEAPPASPRVGLRIALTLAKWVGRAILTLAAAAIAHPVAAALVASGVVAGHWLYQTYGGHILEYLEPPKTLAQLQGDVLSPRQGTDVHHIVEQTSAEAAGYPRSRIDGPDNLVRISTFRHWQINGYYSRYNRDLGMSPREYLRDKNWNERFDYGIDTLKKHGIMIQ